VKFKDVLDRVDGDARDLKPHRVVLTIISAVFIALGWFVGMVFRAVWLVIAWMWAAAVVGFKIATGKVET
jgi:hypothetical protein